MATKKYKVELSETDIVVLFELFNHLYRDDKKSSALKSIEAKLYKAIGV